MGLDITAYGIAYGVKEEIGYWRKDYDLLAWLQQYYKTRAHNVLLNMTMSDLGALEASINSNAMPVTFEPAFIDCEPDDYYAFIYEAAEYLRDGHSVQIEISQ